MGAVAALVVACGTDGGPSTPSTSSTPPPTAQPVDPANCTEKPPQGDIDRSGQGFLFQDGSIDIAVTRPSDTSGRGPGAGVTPTDATTCYEFERWGPAQPDVPPDSLLFVFKDAGAGGAQIEFLISELTGGLLPPVGGARPTVGPLTKPVNAQIGVSVDGVYHHSSTCQLSVTAMSDQLAAGSFSCPTATRVDANPLAPDDDVSYDIDESSTKKPAPTSGPTAGVSLSGWFELRP
ncbi:hypothetical protein [Gordonia sp. 'Campus']|uniref:hypothetical protein n=1 Tax=Gordonia sp. 'Campus' TaxID=2915824 RepID=UPI001EE4BC7D|nr:hypothetical protein [Gordonia sp. 'Campus']